ncbi:hypothetical protein ACLOJK_034078 [Asimina triloba]
MLNRPQMAPLCDNNPDSTFDPHRPSDPEGLRWTAGVEPPAKCNKPRSELDTSKRSHKPCVRNYQRAAGFALRRQPPADNVHREVGMT